MQSKNYLFLFIQALALSEKDCIKPALFLSGIVPTFFILNNVSVARTTTLLF